MSEREKTLERRTENRHILLRILQTARPIRWWLLLGCLLAMVVIICALAGPKLMGNLVQQLYDYWRHIRAERGRQTCRRRWFRGFYACWGSTGCTAFLPISRCCC